MSDDQPTSTGDQPELEPERTDNGPRPEDGPQPAHVPAPGVVVDADGHGVQAGQADDEDLVDVTDFDDEDLS